MSPTTFIFCTDQLYVVNDLRPTTFCLTRFKTFIIWQRGGGGIFPPVLNNFEMFIITPFFFVCDSRHQKVAVIFNKVTCQRQCQNRRQCVMKHRWVCKVCCCHLALRLSAIPETGVTGWLNCSLLVIRIIIPKSYRAQIRVRKCGIPAVFTQIPRISYHK